MQEPAELLSWYLKSEPEPREESVNGTPVEVALANINSRGENFTRQYIQNNCDKNGFPKTQGSTEEQTLKEGLKSLRKKVKDDELFITNFLIYR